MSKHSLYLLVTIIVLLIVLLSSCFGGAKPAPRAAVPKPSPAPASPPAPPTEKPGPATTPAPAPPAQTGLEDAVTVCIGINQLEQFREQNFDVEVWTYPGPYSISAGEVNISFNPNYVNVTDILPGELFGSNPIVGIKRVDNIQGTIKYAVARTGATTRPATSGVFASAKMKVLKSGSATYRFNITEIGFSDQNFEDIQNIVVKNKVLSSDECRNLQ